MVGLRSAGGSRDVKIKQEPQDSEDVAPFVTNAIIDIDAAQEPDPDRRCIYEVKIEPSDSSDSESDDVGRFPKKEPIDPLTGHLFDGASETDPYDGFGKLCDILGVKIEPTVVKVESENCKTEPPGDAVDAFSPATHVPNPAAKKRKKCQTEKVAGGNPDKKTRQDSENSILVEDETPTCFVTLERLPDYLFDKPSVTISELLRIAARKSRKLPKGGTEKKAGRTKRAKKNPKSGSSRTSAVANRKEVVRDSFNCIECEFTSPSKIAMRRHVKDHIRRNSESKFRKCLFCNFESHDPLAMVQHACPRVKARLITCQYCEIQLPRNEIQIHLTERHAKLIELSLTKGADEFFACYYCGYTTGSKETLRSHISVHMGEKKMTAVEYIGGRRYFKCEFCDYKTWRHGCFSRHMNETRKHGGRKNYRCKTCDRYFLRRQHLAYHRMQVHSEKVSTVFECDKCGKNISSKNARSHMKTHEEKTFACELCKYKGHSALTLRNHKVMVHLNFRPYPCSECGHRAKTKNGLDYHKLTHSSEKPFKCPHCDYRANRRFVIQTHVKQVHSSEKPFACPECDYRAKSKGSLVSHFKRHVDARPFRCPVDGCGHRTIAASAMRSHMAKHTGIKPFGCPFCEYRASRTYLIKTHVRLHHRALELEYVGPMRGLS